MSQKLVKQWLKAPCNNCKAELKFKPSFLKRRTVAEGIYQYYFRCGKCKAEYHSYYENNKVKELIEKNAKLQQVIAFGGEGAENAALAIKENKHRIDREQERIKAILKGEKSNDSYGEIKMR